MKLADYLTILDTEKSSLLAVSLDNLLAADDTHDIGLDLVDSYTRAADPAALSHGQNYLISLFRRAADILSGDVLLGGMTYRALRGKVREAGGKLEEQASDREARDLLAAIIDGEATLGWLVADRYHQKIRKQEPGYRGGPDLEDHLQDIQDTLSADPDGRLAVSLSNLLGSRTGGRFAIELIIDFVSGANPEELTGQLARDVTRLKRAIAILRGEITLDGMTYRNLHANVQDMMGNLNNFATSTEARDIALRIIDGVPALAAEIAAREPHPTF